MRTLAAVSCQVAADLLAVSVGMFAAFVLRQLLAEPGTPPAVGWHFLLGVCSLPVWAFTFWRLRLYSAPHTAGRLDELRRIINAALLTTGVMAMMGFLSKVYVSRAWLLLTGLCASVAVIVARGFVRRTFARLRSKGEFLRPVVVVGGNQEAAAVANMLVSEPSLGYRCLGFVADDVPPGTSIVDGQPVLGSIADALVVVRSTGATGAVIATSALDPSVSNRLARQLTGSGYHVELSSSLYDISSSRLFLRPLGRFPVLYVEPVRRDGWHGRAKRLFDVALASLVGLVVLPILAMAAAAIVLGSRGPVLFRQKRVGKHGELFEMLKLRTMVADAEQRAHELRELNQADGPIFKMRSDPRVTPVGRVLRALAIDELPQLWNVLRGDMSLVGPRPALPSEVPLWSEELHGRLTVKPGMTGMWQVSGSRRWHSFDEYSRLDLYYVDNWSIWTDLAILAKTVPAVLFHRDAPATSPAARSAGG